jgi:hypothetical protein
MHDAKLGCLVIGVATAFGFTLAAPALSGNKAHKATPAAQFEAQDTNDDGRLSPDECAAGARTMFEAMDADQDGKVTAAEMAAAHQKVTGKKAKQHELSAEEKIAVVDTNGDGVLTAQEHEAGAKAMFEKMDTTHDGELSKGEVNAGHARMLKKPGK